MRSRVCLFIFFLSLSLHQAVHHKFIPQGGNAGIKFDCYVLRESIQKKRSELQCLPEGHLTQETQDVFFFFAHTNRIFAHHLDHSSDLALCNLVHFLKMKNKLMGHCLDTLEEIQRVSRMELDALTECDCEKCHFFPTVALRSTSTCHRHSIRHHSSSFEAVKTIFYVVRMLQLVLMNLI